MEICRTKSCHYITLQLNVLLQHIGLETVSLSVLHVNKYLLYETCNATDVFSHSMDWQSLYFKRRVDNGIDAYI
jgi:hypothetical protein